MDAARRDGALRAMATAAEMTSVVVLVLTHGGQRRVGPCLRSIASSDQVPVELRVVVVDNGSPDPDAIATAVREALPDASVMRLPENLGFAQGYDVAVGEVDAEWLLLLNDDTAVTPTALRRLWDATSAGHECVGARLVSWDGQRLDFDGGGAALTGHGHPFGNSRRVPREPAEPRPTLFTSGAATLIRRDAFERLGGFDPDYFAYYEDVDLGWRLWLTGMSACHVPSAVVRHVGGATGDNLASERRTRLHERNAIATVFKCYDNDLLARVLPASLALAAHRAGADVAVVDEALPAQEAWPPVPDDQWSGWPALAHLQLDFEALGCARERVQAGRVRRDAELIPLLAEPYAPVPATHAAREAMRRAVTSFRLDEVFGTAGADAGSAGYLGARAVEALRSGGPANLVDEARRYLAWRRAGGA